MKQIGHFVLTLLLGFFFFYLYNFSQRICDVTNTRVQDESLYRKYFFTYCFPSSVIFFMDDTHYMGGMGGKPRECVVASARVTAYDFFFPLSRF